MHTWMISIGDAAKAMSLSRSTIYEMINKGELATGKFGRRTLISVDSIKALIAARTGQSFGDQEIAA